MTPTRKRATDFHPHILEIFDGYVHGVISKRDFIKQAGKFAAVGVTGAMILDQLQPNYAWAAQVEPDDPAILAERISYESPEGHGTINALMAKPAGATDKLPAVLVIHENRGLNPYMSRGGWPRPVIWRWRPTACPRWAAIPAMMTTGGRCSGRSTARN